MRVAAELHGRLMAARCRAIGPATSCFLWSEQFQVLYGRWLVCKPATIITPSIHASIESAGSAWARQAIACHLPTQSADLYPAQEHVLQINSSNFPRWSAQDGHVCTRLPETADSRHYIQGCDIVWDRVTILADLTTRTETTSQGSVMTSHRANRQMSTFTRARWRN